MTSAVFGSLLTAPSLLWHSHNARKTKKDIYKGNAQSNAITPKNSSFYDSFLPTTRHCKRAFLKSKTSENSVKCAKIQATSLRVLRPGHLSCLSYYYFSSFNLLSLLYLCRWEKNFFGENYTWNTLLFPFGRPKALSSDLPQREWCHQLTVCKLWENGIFGHNFF